MTRLKPNVLRLAQQNTRRSTRSRAARSGSRRATWARRGRVTEAGGPKLAVFTPKEGTDRLDGRRDDRDRWRQHGAHVRPWLEQAEQPEYIAENFLRYGRPLFNEARVQGPGEQRPAGAGGPVPVQQARDRPDHDAQGPGFVHPGRRSRPSTRSSAPDVCGDHLHGMTSAGRASGRLPGRRTAPGPRASAGRGAALAGRARDPRAGRAVPGLDGCS